ncbi:MAG: hypothetical protein JO043_00480 [Candidatus Eremiobacteraeota bacterium]|nr:hypothetical protein [Candidatus Eremiobacteraeota bacterium]
MRLRPLTEWSIGKQTLQSFDVRLCLKHPVFGVPLIDGSVPSALTGGVTFTNRRTHRLDAPVVLRRQTVLAAQVIGNGLTFEFIAPFAADKVQITVPHRAGLLGLVATAFGSDDTELGTGFDAEGTSSFQVPIIVRPILAGERCFIDFQRSGKPSWPSIRHLHSIVLTLAVTAEERAFFRLPANVGAALPLRGTDVRYGMRERQNGFGGAQFLHPKIAWVPDDNRQQAPWRISGRNLDMEPSGGASILRASGTLLQSDRYRLNAQYRAAGDATLEFQVAGYLSNLRLPLRRDGRLHRLSETIFVPTGNPGGFALIARTMQGELHLRDADLSSTGPSALVYRLQPGRLHGALRSSQRRAAWWFHASLANCHPCALRVAVSDATLWWLRGARVLGVYQSDGQSAGMAWSGSVTGASVWVIDAGSGPENVDLLFFPALLAAGGLLVAAATLVAGILLLRRAPVVSPREELCGEPVVDEIGRGPSLLPWSTDAIRFVAIALGVTLALTSVTAEVSNNVGGALWACLVVLSVLLFVHPRKSMA